MGCGWGRGLGEFPNFHVCLPPPLSNCGQLFRNEFAPNRRKFLRFTHCLLVDSSIVICWTSLSIILGVSGLFCRFYSVFDGKSC